MPAHFDEDKKIFFIDYRDLRGEELLREIEKTRVIGKASYKGGKADVLVDIRGAILDKQIVETLKTMNKRDNYMISKTAVVGITGLKKILADAIALFSGNETKNFNTIAEAENWLQKK